MKQVDNRLYMEFSDMLDCGIPENTLKSAKIRKSASWTFIDDPEDGRKVLIDFEKLGNSYKEKVKARFGNPYDYFARQPIKAMVKWDVQAEQFYLDYSYNGNKKLPKIHVDKYTKAASWLNMLKEATEDKKTLKKLLNLSIDSFYAHVIELIKSEDVDLPTSYRRLLDQRRKYEETGYSALIDWRFGNKLAAKVCDEKSESVLLEMIAHPNQYDDVFIAYQYNIWAKENGYDTIDPATVGNHRRNKEHLIIMQREGNAALNEKFLPQVKGFRPSAPLYMVESDDNHLDLLFTDPDNPKLDKRYVAIVVIDSYNDYVLGYAYALQGNLNDGSMIALVRAAYFNAMYHIKEITGNWFLPHETKTDRFGISSLRPFYHRIGKYFDTPIGSKHRGYIEQFFGSPHWKRCLKAGANNYSGNNITARNRGVNMESLRLNKKERPLIGDQATEQIEQFFHRLRHMPQSNGISKHEQWLQGWNNLPDKDKRQISDEQFLLRFGIQHNYNDEGIRITNRGVEPQIGGKRYSYNLEQYNAEFIGKSVTVIYDPYDMSRVLVTDFEKIRLIGRDARMNSRALADASAGSREYLNQILEDKRDLVKRISAASDKRKEVLKDDYIVAEAVLQSGVATKEIKMQAEDKMLNALINNKSNNDDDIFDQI